MYNDIHFSGVLALRWYSIRNTWMDCVVFVPEAQATTATALIQQAIDEYWSGVFETYGDAIETTLAKYSIPFAIKYYDEKAGTNAEEEWISWLEGLSSDLRVRITEI